MAEARSAVAEPRVYDLKEGKNAWKDLALGWRYSVVRSFYRTRNLIRNGMWPTSVYNLGVGVALFSTSMIGGWKIVEPVNRRLWAVSRILHLPSGLPYYVHIFVISSTSGIAFFIALLYTRRWLLRILLTYRGWMYETPRRQSWLTKLWGRLVWMASGYQPTTYSYQKSLPRLPVPPLSQTIDQFLLSMQPLYGANSEQFKKLSRSAQEFKTGIGPKLQRLLVLKSFWAQNWVSDWWEKYVYLMSRMPTAINSNYYVLDFTNWCPTQRQTSRAASSIYQFMMCKRLIEHETLPPMLIRSVIPLCMAQYEKLFSTTRVPGVEFDTLVKFDSSVSKHVIVQRLGLYYQLDVFDSERQLLMPQMLQKQLDWIIADADKAADEYSSQARSIGALTALGRTDWARVRSDNLTSGVNQQSLDALESAVFHVVLDTNSFSSWTEEGKHLLHGDGSTLWFDKSFTAVFFANGRLGLNAEHSWGDAPTMGHISEYNLTTEILGRLYDDDGYVVPVNSVTQASVKTPQRLLWELSPTLEQTIDRALAFCRKHNDDLDLIISEHTAYGKGFIKTCSVSPDAYIQLALQLAYYKDSKGRLAMTYESSMTRLFLLGRTETVRSLTNECADFVKAMNVHNRDVSKCIALLHRACERHQMLYRDAMCGRGVDRHLFGLFVICKGLGQESEFLKNALMVPWTLSTSQQPQQQIQTSPDCNNPEFKNKLCPGGGFGPVSDDGYGVSYMVPGDATLYFHVSSKHSSGATDSARFVRLLFESLQDMRQLFVDIAKNNH